jgi:predicted O-linked N-acetylglucosamine transferase (SPINDLY family)
MNSEERVLDMMAQLDEHSENIPDGMYLQFCDHLKFFYQNVQNKKKRVAAETERQSRLQQAVEAGWPSVERLAADYRARQADMHASVAAETERRLAIAQGDVVEGMELVAMLARPRGPRRCGCCREIGHNQRRCPQRVQ